jgi:transposase
MNRGRRRSYDRNFKAETVRLMTEKKYSIAEASRRLNIEYSVLRRWKKQIEKAFQPSTKESGIHESDVEVSDLKGELIHLRNELQRLKEERDILVKALGVFIGEKRK